MKSDARILLNSKKWKNAANSRKAESWKSRDFKSSGTLDARKILNLKRSQKAKTPVYGSYMRTKTATALIASQIRKEIIPETKVPEKWVRLSRDGNLIITSKSKKSPEMLKRKELSYKTSFNRQLQGNMQWELSTSDTDDLEHTALEDLIDMDSLPPAYISPRVAQNMNLSRRPAINDVLEMKNTMVADQLSSPQSPEKEELVGAKIYVSNLHPSVSLADVMELFGDVGIITDVEMLRPGTAIIHFQHEVDAQKACDIYHNRLLDGQPMKCYVQVDSKPQKSTISQRLGNRIVSPPTQKNLSKSIMTNPRSRYNPRNVQFTVKLT